VINSRLKQLSAVLCALVLASCAASLPYSADYPLTDQTFRSRNGIFSGRVPRGWFSSAEDSIAPALEAWLIKDDLSSTLAVKELKLDQTSAHEVGEKGLQLLAQISFAMQRGISGKASMTAEPRDFEMREKKFCSYEVSDGGKRKRVVVFSGKGRYFECEAMVVKGSLSPEEILRMFTAQQTMLSSLAF
jgi:hypothetical protein